MCGCIHSGRYIYFKELDHEAIEAWQAQSVVEWLTECV